MTKKIIMTIFIALIVFSAIYALWDRRDVTTSSEKAYEVYQAGDAARKKLYYRDAIADFEKAIKIDTNFAMAYANLATLYNDRGRSDEAKELLKKAESLFSHVTRREQGLIKVMSAQVNKDASQLAKAHREFIDKFPDDLDSYRYRAEIYMQQHDYKMAINEFEKLIKKDPGDALAYNMLGYLNLYDGNYDEALSYIRKYSVLATREANPHDSYGEILMYLGRYDEAIKEFETADKIKPDLMFVTGHLGAVYLCIGRYRDAIGYFERALDIAEGDIQIVEAKLNIAFAYVVAGKYDKALPIINDVLAGHSDNQRALAMQGMIWARQGKFEPATENLALIDDIIHKNKTPEDTISIMDRGNSLFLEGIIAFEKAEYDIAEENFRELMVADRPPDIYYMRNFLGETYQRMNKFAEAESVYAENLDENPNEARTLFLMAQLYRERGKADKQKQMLLRYLSVMSGADDDVANVITARAQLDSLSISS